MTTEAMNDKLSIKNLLFTKAIPNYVIPVPTAGHKVYSCIDCGDRFILQSSYEYHVNRQSVKITYLCKHCSQLKTFYNRCNLLSHIRSHAFKTATINVSDLKIEPLPLSHFKKNVSENSFSGVTVASIETQPEAPDQNLPKQKTTKCVCLECKIDITSTGTIYKDRKKHFMQYSTEVHSCPVCLFTLPTKCALSTHMRLHLKTPPYFCPECGVHLSTKNVSYPYNHDCDGFNMMRATARSKCPIPGCQVIHPSFLKAHIKDNHMKKVLKCPLCNVACFNKQTIDAHILTHNTDCKSTVFYQCEICPGRLVHQRQAENHIKGHSQHHFVFPCWVCGMVILDIPSLLIHFSNNHSRSDNTQCNVIIDKNVNVADNRKAAYRVIKKCDNCKRTFRYKCKFDQINILPNECPYKCISNTDDISKTMNPCLTITNNAVSQQNNIICHICKTKISQQWEDIKKHYAEHHPLHKCVDAKVTLTKLNLKKNKVEKKRTPKIKISFKSTSSRKRNRRRNVKNKNKQNSYQVAISEEIEPLTTIDPGKFICKCGIEFETKLLLEEHMISHRDPCMAYQCMECGKCFVVKPSFSTHLLLDHGISDVESYVNTKKCYNENALYKYQDKNIVPDEPLQENQCKICREQFDNLHDLEKHFRIHGMAFLMKNTEPTEVSGLDVGI